ncbi:hypothetical protein HPB51_004423 [Rhipicephalus microplus]|uniref:FAM65 N-terminal domain-containing protein n=1 Tax=Rhipicephalus microplus TaxID=6941 RepID=A0A9J6ELH8_RHIMP|nr:hypothetical protein HPB51_004423 [Rhipicephalus microplus]
MSLSERLKPRPTADPGSGSVLARSRSFAGLLQGGHRRTPSAASGVPADGSLSSSSGASSGSSTLSKSISSTWSGKPPRSPRPARTLLIFNAVERGLRECVSLAQEDILSLRSSVDNLSLSSSQQLKAAERYLKRIEFQLSKVEELREHYEVQQRMRDGVRSMAYAYVLSPGCEKDNALHGVRSGYRECVDTLCVLEAHLEQLMGTLQFQMRGIQGFARLCAGDVFEISVKHGDQKWKSRGRVQKNGQQVWDNQQVIMKALLGEFLFIKAVEVRGLGKNMLLGNKSCEIKELFSSHSQLMTINLNSSGSLKLNLVITWNPLHGCMEDNLSGSKQSPPVLSVMSSPFTRRRGTSPFRNDTILERTGSMVHELETGQRDWRPQVTEWEGPRRRMTPQGGQAWVVTVARTAAAASTWPNRAEMCLHLQQAQSPLREAVQGLSACLEDIQGHYPELHSLEQSIAELDRMLRKRSHHRRGSTGSNVSISVESALGCFDFLDSEETESSESSPVRHSPYKSRETKNGGTADSGVALLKDRKSPISGASTPSPVTVSTGSDQLDCVIAVHCRYCIRLVESLGTFGPLRCRERTSIEKLQHQSRLLYKLLRVANRFAEDRRQLYEPSSSFPGSQLVEEDDIGHLWCQMGTNDGLVTTLTRLREPLARLVRSRLNNGAVSERGKHCLRFFMHTFSVFVVIVVLQKMLDVARLEPDMLVTVLQFQTYFAQLGSTLFMDHVEQLEAERSTFPPFVFATSTVAHRTPSACLNLIISPKIKLFTQPDILDFKKELVINSIKQYLKAAAKVTSKAQICALLVEGLEADAALTRQGCCRALSFLQAQEYMEELVHLSYADEVAKVRQQAKEALFSFGEDGRREFQQSQLVAHGFQGLTVK